MTATVRQSRRPDERSGRTRTPRGLAERVTFGHIAPALLAVLAAVFVAVALKDRSATVQVPVASAPIAAGASVDAANTRLVSLHASDAVVRAGLLSPSSLAANLVATVPIVPGDAITRSEVAAAASGNPGLGAMSLPVPISNADGGAIIAGDHVDVIAESGADGARYVAQDLRVLSVPSSISTSGVLATNTNDYYVVVAVDRATALRLASALSASSAQASTAAIEIVRTTGETPAANGGAG